MDLCISQYITQFRTKIHTKNSPKWYWPSLMRYTLHIMSSHRICEWSCLLFTAYSSPNKGVSLVDITYMSHMCMMNAISVRGCQTQFTNWKYFRKTQSQYGLGSRTHGRIWLSCTVSLCCVLTSPELWVFCGWYFQCRQSSTKMATVWQTTFTFYWMKMTKLLYFNPNGPVNNRSLLCQIMIWWHRATRNYVITIIYQTIRRWQATMSERCSLRLWTCWIYWQSIIYVYII